MFIRRTELCLLAAFALASCSNAESRKIEARFSASGREVAVSKQDLERLVGQKRCYTRLAHEPVPEPNAVDAFVAFVDPILSYLALASLGKLPDKKALEAEAERIEKETRAPMTLGCIKRLHGSDRDSYLRLYVAPFLMDRLLQTELRYNPKYNQDAHRAAEAMRARILATPSERRALAFRQEGRRERTFVRSTPPSDVAYLAGTKPGEIYHDIIEGEDSMQLVRVVRKDPRLEIETITIAKRPFEKILEELDSNLTVTVEDTELRAGLSGRSRSSWWHSRINFGG
jgi:hypothetical protein